eukprot:1248778-Rhodomonas_salina.1
MLPPETGVEGGRAGHIPPIMRRVCYAMSGTDIGMQHGCYAMFGTDIGMYAVATRCPALT